MKKEDARMKAPSKVRRYAGITLSILGIAVLFYALSTDADEKSKYVAIGLALSSCGVLASTVGASSSKSEADH